MIGDFQKLIKSKKMENRKHKNIKETKKYRNNSEC